MNWGFGLVFLTLVLLLGCISPGSNNNLGNANGTVLRQDYSKIGNVAGSSGGPTDPRRISFTFTGKVIDSVDYVGPPSCRSFQDNGSGTVGIVGTDPNGDGVITAEECTSFGGNPIERKMTVIHANIRNLVLVNSSCQKSFTLNKTVALVYENPQFLVSPGEQIGGVLGAFYPVEFPGEYATMQEYYNSISLEQLSFPSEETTSVDAPFGGYQKDGRTLLFDNAIWLSGLEVKPNGDAETICKEVQEKMRQYYQTGVVS